MFSLPDILGGLHLDWSAALAFGLILASVWINTGYRRYQRRRHIAGVEQALRDKLETMLSLIPRIERIDLSWTPQTGQAGLLFGFDVGNFDYHVDIGFDPMAVARHVVELVGEDLHASENEPEATELPPPPVTEPRRRTWWEVLGVSRDADTREIRVAHRQLSLKKHPDLGGSDEEMAEINAARDEALGGR